MDRAGRQAAVSVAALLLWLGWWLGVASPQGSAIAVVLAWLPLAPALPWVARGGPKAAGWCSLAGVFYAGFAAMEVVANPLQRLHAGIALVLTLVMIAALVRLIRSRRPQPS